jgi:hypothetical protein
MTLNGAGQTRSGEIRRRSGEEKRMNEGGGRAGERETKVGGRGVRRAKAGFMRWSAGLELISLRGLAGQGESGVSNCWVVSGETRGSRNAGRWQQLEVVVGGVAGAAAEQALSNWRLERRGQRPGAGNNNNGSSNNN